MGNNSAIGSVVPCLNFNGRCREAMTYYHDCFGGELGLTTVAETTIAHEYPGEQQDYVVTSQLSMGSFLIIGADIDKLTDCNHYPVTLTVEIDDAVQCEEVFGKLAEGGRVVSPLTPQFWGAVSGEVTDRFGIQWLIYRRIATGSQPSTAIA